MKYVSAKKQQHKVDKTNSNPDREFKELRKTVEKLVENAKSNYFKRNLVFYFDFKYSRFWGVMWR